MDYSTSQVAIKVEPQDEPTEIVRPEVIQYCPRLTNPIPPNPYNIYPQQYVMAIPPYQVQPAHFYHHQNQLVLAPQLCNIPAPQGLYPQLSPATATPATYGNHLSLSPREAASIGNQLSQRPFKALTSPRANPLPLIASLDPSTEAAYEDFKNKMMARVSTMSGQGSRNRNMSRNVPANPDKLNDPEYLEKRRKNNEAAKKSRDARKTKEDEMAIRVAFLEKEVYKLMYQLVMLQKEKREKLEARKRDKMPRLMPIQY